MRLMPQIETRPALCCAGRQPVAAFTSRIRLRTFGSDAAAAEAPPAAPREPACPAYVEEDSRNRTQVVEFEECLRRHGRSLDVGVPDRHGTLTERVLADLHLRQAELHLAKPEAPTS